LTRFARSSDVGLDESAEDLFENAPCGYLSAAPDGMLIRVNATFLRWTGYRREDLVGVKRFQDLLSVGGRIYHETHYAPMLRMQGSVREIAVDIVGANGDRLPVLINSVLVRDEQGEPQVVRTTVFDATERMLYERELLAARDRERIARERTERLQRITTLLAAAADAPAIAAAVTGELIEALGAAGGGVTLHEPGTEERPALAAPDEGFDEGDERRGASVRLPVGTAGRLWLDFEGAREFSPETRAFLVTCAAQTGLALERSRLYEETRDVSHTLQRSLLAGDPPRDERFEVATLYHAAVEHLEVGGDWHDAFWLADGRIGITVGDVVGRGLGAASAMGQLRSAVRALAAAGLEPAAVLGHLDTYVAEVEAARYATLAYAEVDPESGVVCFASAGHLPPVTIEPEGEPRLFMEGRSAPLGVTGPEMSPRTQASFTLGPGAGFLLYTDGLVERRTEAIDVGLERLLEAVRAAASHAPAHLVDTLPAALIDLRTTHDDVCLLSFRRSRARG